MVHRWRRRRAGIPGQRRQDVDRDFPRFGGTCVHALKLAHLEGLSVRGLRWLGRAPDADEEIDRLLRDRGGAVFAFLVRLQRQRNPAPGVQRVARFVLVNRLDLQNEPVRRPVFEARKNREKIIFRQCEPTRRTATFPFRPASTISRLSKPEPASVPAPAFSLLARCASCAGIGDGCGFAPAQPER